MLAFVVFLMTETLTEKAIPFSSPSAAAWDQLVKSLFWMPRFAFRNPGTSFAMSAGRSMPHPTFDR